MKKKLFNIAVFAAIFCSQFISAQVGIGTTSPHSSSILHLNSSNKGLLLTSIALTSSSDVTTISTPATGLLVWNNGTGGFTPTGLYYWSGSAWTALSSSTNNNSTNTSGWSTSGNNSGASAGASTALSLGTSTYDDLIFKVNNTFSGRLGTNNSVQFGTGTSASQSGTALGHNAKATSNESTAVGANSSAAGYQSVALGYNSKTNSNNETAIGINTNTNGQNSTALGSGASATGQNSSAIRNATTASMANTVALGSGASASGQNSTAIGFGATTSQTNAIILGNSSATVGIGTNTPNNTTKLDVNGQFKLGEKGSVHKNTVSFEAWPGVSLANYAPGQSGTIDIAIPPAMQISSTRATIVVSPANDFSGNLTFGITNPRMTSASTITVNATNISGSTASLYSGHFYVTVNEF